MTLLQIKPTSNIRKPLKHKVNLKGISNTAWKVSQYGVISGPYFPEYGEIRRYVFSLNTGKYGPEITPYSDTIDTVQHIISLSRYHRIFNEWSINILENVDVSDELLPLKDVNDIYKDNFVIIFWGTAI